MPELPEVELVKQILAPQICGCRINKLVVVHPQVLAHPAPNAFCQGVENATITAVARRGKYLQIHLDTGATLLVHLRMTGQFLCMPAQHALAKHTHLIFVLNNGQELRYIDVRRFGRLWLMGPGERDTHSGLPQLGCEPFDDAFCADYLQGQLGRRHISIKQALLDQSVVAGLGNIYTDEALFAAGICPTRKTASLTPDEWQALAKHIPAVLDEAIQINSAISAPEYLAGEGKEYRNTPFFRVYGREGLPCPRCGATIERTKIAGRSSCHCPACQPR